MTERLRQLWAERSAREQQLLAVMFALLALVVLVFGIIRPLASATTAARDRLDRVTVEAGQIAAAVETLRDAKKGAPPPLTGTMVLAVSQSAGTAGFTLSTLDPQGDDRVGITIPTAKSPALFAWLRTLAGQGVFVERMTLRTNADATLAVEGTLRLRKS
jgi:general secretion pathway protein M